MPTGNQRHELRGRGMGIAVGAAIAGGWAVYAASVLAPGNAAAIVLAVSVAAVLVSAGVAAMRASRALPVADTAPQAKGTRARRLFLLNLIGEIVALNLLAYALARLGGMAYLVPGVAVVVGLHFLPMAGFFDYPLFNWTGVLMIAAALATVAVMHAGALPFDEAGGIDAAVNAMILWGTAAAGLLALNRQRAAGSIAR